MMENKSTHEEDFDKFKVGNRVQFIEDREVFPHFRVEKGASGEVVSNDSEGIKIKMDDKIDGAETWDNEVHFYLEDDLLHPSDYIKIIGE